MERKLEGNNVYIKRVTTITWKTYIYYMKI